MTKEEDGSFSDMALATIGIILSHIQGIVASFTTPPREISLSPDGGVPYALNTVEAALDGYVPLTALHIALFSGVPALLPVALTPLPEYESTAPAELTSDGQTQVLSSERE